MAVDNPETRSPGLASESVPGPTRIVPAQEFSLYCLDGPDAAATMIGSLPFSATQYSRYKYGSVAAAEAFARALGEALCERRPSATAMSWSVGVLKPDPLIYQAALGALGVAPGEAAYVGDGGDSELRGARRLGLRTVLIERGLPHTQSARADADVCCADLADAGRVLLGQENRLRKPSCYSSATPVAN